MNEAHYFLSWSRERETDLRATSYPVTRGETAQGGGTEQRWLWRWPDSLSHNSNTRTELNYLVPQPVMDEEQQVRREPEG